MIEYHTASRVVHDEKKGSAAIEKGEQGEA